MNRLKLAELTSGVGALVLGVGLGVLFPHWFGPAAGLVALAGLSIHAFGMWDKHRLEAVGPAENPLWIVAFVPGVVKPQPYRGVSAGTRAIARVYGRGCR